MTHPGLGTPLTFAPVLVAKPWGGHRLSQLGRPADPGTPTGESWDVTDLADDATPVPEPVSRVVGGLLDDHRLDALMQTNRDDLLGGATPSREGRFPLLVKLLDAAENLSVQVHPPRSLAPDRHKTESWVIVDAEPDAVIFLGVRDGVALGDVRAAAGTSGLIDLLARVAVSTGDVVHVPAGTIHALGGGVLVAEIQTPSDLTYRLWDWPEHRDGGRELHVGAGLAAIEEGWEHNRAVQVAKAHDGVLVTTEAYTLARESLEAGATLAASTVADRPRVCIVLKGGLEWIAGDTGEARRRARSETVLLPAASDVPLVATTNGTQVLVATAA